MCHPSLWDTHCQTKEELKMYMRKSIDVSAGDERDRG